MDSLPFQDLRDMSEINVSKDGALLRKPELRYTSMSTIRMNPECKRHIENQCDRFARSATVLGNAWRSNLPLQSAQAVQQTVAEINQIMMDAERAIQERMSRLRVEVDDFGRLVYESSDDRWYRNIEDLTAFESDGFSERLLNMRIRDFDDFANYLKETLPAAARKVRPSGQYSGHAFLGRVGSLLDITLRSASPHLAFSLLATVKAKVFILDQPRMPVRYLPERVAKVDAELLRLLDVHSTLAEKDEYWDFASSWRLLVSSWEEMASDAGPLLQVLEPIRKKAVREVRHGTTIAVNRRLPQELADLVFEHAMVVEEIPLEAE